MTPKITENCSLPSYRNVSKSFVSSRPTPPTCAVDTLLTALPCQAIALSQLSMPVSVPSPRFLGDCWLMWVHWERESGGHGQTGHKTQGAKA